MGLPFGPVGRTLAGVVIWGFELSPLPEKDYGLMARWLKRVLIPKLVLIPQTDFMDTG